MIGTTFNITLKAIRDGIEYESYTYQDGRASGPEWEFDDPITMDDVKGVRAAITKFKDLVLHNCDPLTNGDSQPTKREIQEVPATGDDPAKITFEFTCGDLAAEMVYDKDANTFTGNQSAFDIVWCDFMAYIIAWDSFFKVVERRDA